MVLVVGTEYATRKGNPLQRALTSEVCQTLISRHELVQTMLTFFPIEPVGKCFYSDFHSQLNYFHVLQRSDNDMYSHINNSVYYHLFDSVINTYLIEHCGLSPPASPLIGLVVSSFCQASAILLCRYCHL